MKKAFLIRRNHEATLSDLLGILHRRRHPARWVVEGVLHSLRGVNPMEVIEDYVPAEHHEDYLMGNPKGKSPSLSLAEAIEKKLGFVPRGGWNPADGRG